MPYKNFFACSFFQGMITTASPSSFSKATSSPLICCGVKPTAIRSGQTNLSYFTANFCTSQGVSLKLITFPTPLLAQFFTPFLTTYYLTSQRVIDLAYVHFPRATPARPTPDFTTSTSLPLNRSLSRMTYRATMTSISHRRNPSNSCGKISRSEMVAFILKPQCRMMSRLRRRRISLGDDPPCDYALFLEAVPLGCTPINHYIIHSGIGGPKGKGKKGQDGRQGKRKKENIQSVSIRGVWVLLGGVYIISMSRQEDPQTEHYQPAFNGILSINDYEQQEQETYPQEGQELPFDEIEQILSDPSSITTRTESLLLMAVNYLQQRCTQLASSNTYLQLRQQDLLQQLSFQEEVEISQEIAHSFLESVQQELDNYKNEFSAYRERHLGLRRELVQENGRLVRRVDELQGMLRESQAERDILEQERKELQMNNENLLDSNSELQERLEQIEDQLQSIREERRQGTYRGTNGHRMDGQVQAEMQDMIDKLMGELQVERRQRLTISAQCKQLQKQLLHLQRQLSDKNNKIYQLELHSLRQNRNNQPSSTQAPPSPRGIRPAIDRTTTNGNNSHNNRQQPSSSSFRTFSLATVNGSDFTKKTRLVIAVKVVQFYLRKVNKGDLTTHTLEGLVVYNYSALYPQACIIRKDKALPSKEGQCTQERLVWNLAFLLDHILTNDGQEALTKIETRLTSLINSILQEQSCTIADMEQLRALAEEASRMAK